MRFLRLTGVFNNSKTSGARQTQKGFCRETKEQIANTNLFKFSKSKMR
jgi:hypothetical protein